MKGELKAFLTEQFANIDTRLTSLEKPKRYFFFEELLIFYSISCSFFFCSTSRRATFTITKPESSYTTTTDSDLPPPKKFKSVIPPLLTGREAVAKSPIKSELVAGLTALDSKPIDPRPWNGHIHGRSISELFLRIKAPEREDVVEVINRVLNINPNNNFVKDVGSRSLTKEKN